MTFLDQVAGFIGGGPGELNLDTAYGAAVADVAAKATAVKDDLLSKAQSFGAKLGPVWGTGVFANLLKGAQSTAAPAVAANEQKLFGLSFTQMALIGLAGLFVILAVVRGK